MAVDMFIKIDGIKGESKDSKHKEDIDVLAWSWGLSNSGSAHVGGGAGAGKVNVQDLSFTKWLDKASTALMLHGMNGKHIKEALLTVRKAGETQLEYLKIKLQDILISGVQHSGHEGGDLLSESLTLNFAKFHVEYQEQDSKGKGTPAGEMGWDVKANVKA